MSDPNVLVDFSSYPKRFELNDGSEVSLRPMRPDDRDRLFAFFKSLSKRDRRYFKHDVSQREVITNWCRHLDYDRVLPILAIIKEDGKERVIADGTLHTERHGWSTHVAQVRVVITQKHRKRGLGQIMLRELYDRAIDRGVEKVQAYLRHDDTNAAALLKKMGYKKEATFREHALDVNGRKHDVNIYYSDLGELWSRMDDLNIDSDFFMVP